ncbi:MAG: hypothetical protein ACXQTE_04290, partial [Methanosarcinaceae archaeon]
MIILHGTWNPPDSITERGQLFLWGEDPSRPLKRRGRPPKTIPGAARTHNFQAIENDLLDLIKSLDLKNDTKVSERAHADDLTIILPSFSKYPQPSPDMFREDDDANTEDVVVQAPWKINGLSIPPE